jgi:hypothetical protein
MVFVEFDPLADRVEIFHLRGVGKIERRLRGRLRVGEIAGFGAGHAQHVKNHRLAAAGQIVRLDGEDERGPAIARGGILIGGEDVRGVGEDLKIIRLDAQRGAEFVHGLDVAAL